MNELTNEQQAIIALQKLGYDNGFTGSGIGLDVQGFNVGHLALDYPDEWAKHYQEQSLIYRDPTVLYGNRLNDVVAWSELKLDNQNKNYVLDHAKMFDLNDGLVIPFSIYGKKNIICYSVKKHRNFDFNLKEYLLYKSRLIVSFYTKPQFKLHDYDSIDVNLLSTLTLVAQGNNQKHIAEVQGISVPAVKKRIQKICKLLDASNTCHAVSLAKDADLIA